MHVNNPLKLVPIPEGLPDARLLGAAKAGAKEAAFGLTIWLAGLVLALLVVVVVLAYARKRFLRMDSSDPSGFSIEDIRRMRDRGELSEGEYRALRRRFTGPAVQSEVTQSGRSLDKQL